jgi:VWFA-related protein
MHFVPDVQAWRALTLVACVLMPGGGIAQEQAVFRSGVDLLTVDATVVGPDGLPDEALRAADFVLKVNGRPRRVVSAQFVRNTTPAQLRPPIERRHFSSNEFVDPGRFVVVAIDEPHIRRLEGRAALQAAADFIDRLDPLDRVAVLGLGRGGPLEFTRDRGDAKRRVGRLVGQGDHTFLQFNIGLTEAVEIADGGRVRLAEVVQRECGRALTEYLNPARAAEDPGRGRDACPEQVEGEAVSIAQHARTQARISLSALEGLVAALRDLNRPTTLVLLSEGLVADPRLLDFTELAVEAQQARVAIYVLHVDAPLFEPATDRVSPTFLRDVQLRGDGLARLAGAARGAVFRLVGSDPAPFRRIADELSGHYLIAFEALPTERDGRIHRVELAVTGGGRTVRARHAFRLPATSASPRARELELVQLLRSTLPASELPVRVATYTSIDPSDPNVRVVVSTEAEGAGTAAQEGLVLGYVLVDSRGVVVASGAHRTSGGRHAFTTRVPRGPYTLRVGGIDPLGRRGMVERAFMAAVQQHESLLVSDLILAPVPPTREAPLQPLVDRVDDSRMVAYLELSAAPNQTLADVGVQFEIRTEEMTSTAVDAAAEVSPRAGRWARARAELQLETLPSGRYVAIARVMHAGREIARVSRPFRVR